MYILVLNESGLTFAAISTFLYVFWELPIAITASLLLSHY